MTTRFPEIPPRDFDAWEPMLDALMNMVETHDYVLTGALALGFYGCIRATRDMDLLVQMPMAVIGTKAEVLKALTDAGFEDAPTKFVEEGLVHRFVKDAWRVDVLEQERATYREIEKRSTKVPWKGGVIKVIAPEDLVRMKLKRGTDQDNADIKCLQWVLEQEIARGQK